MENKELKEIGLAEASPFSQEKLKEMEKELASMTIAEAIEENPELADKLTEMGFGCAGCACSQFETLEDGIAGHGINPEEVIKELNKGRKNEKK